VDFVPGLPGLGTPPPPPPAAATGAHAPGPAWPETLDADEPTRERAGARVARLPQDRGALAGIGLAVLALVLLQLGLALDFGTESLWDVVPLWSAFATLAALVGLLAVVLASSKTSRARARQAWPVGAAALVGLAVFWLLVVLPGADSDRGFLLTAALACLGAALWIGAKRD
jgi:peptidoglycan/LPS O-acetylase OafA/YrhL